MNKVLTLNLDTFRDQEDQHEAEGFGVRVEDGAPLWKVLVFDNLGRDVISTILRVEDLRKQGITIFLNINATRHAIPDVPVIVRAYL